MTADTRSVPAGTLRTLLRRWPTLLAVGTAALTLSDLGDGTEFAFVLIVAAVGYLAIAVIERPRATWPLVAVTFAIVVAVRLAGGDDRLVVLSAGVVLAVVGLARGSLRRPGLPSRQLPAAVLFAAAGLIGAALDPGPGRYLVAAGLFAHAAWDGYHWWRNRIVARSFAEWCGVLDALLAVGILVLV